jgi:hypothetical protein
MFAPFLQKHAVKSPTLLRAVSWALCFLKVNKIKRIVQVCVRKRFLKVA